MTKQSKSKDIIAGTSDKLKAIFKDDDIIRLEYPVNEFPLSQTQILIIFTKQSGKEPQYIELQDWLDLVEEYKAQESENLREQNIEHDEEFVCLVSFRLNGDNNSAGQAVVSAEERDDCVNAILDKYPQVQLDLSIKFMCKQCFKEKHEKEMIAYYGSRMIH